MSTGACDACLRRTWLVARLAPNIARAAAAARPSRRLREVLALSDAALIAALSGSGRTVLEAEYEAFDPDRARAASDATGLEALCRCAPTFPTRLLHADDAPAVLHVLGGVDRLLALLERMPVAIVGARRATPYGLEVARGLGRALAAAGVSVISGMALGVDSAAHAGALDASGQTVAVLAGGADVPYPAGKRALHRRIAEAGCVLSELPPGFTAHRWCFPARNRIIAGLAEMTVVVEAAARSGSLITAEFARDLGRDVGAVPGQVTNDRAAGANALLADGALLVRDAQDVLDALFGAGVRVAPGGPDRGGLAPWLSELLDAVGGGHDTLDALARGARDAEMVLGGLTELELLGLVRRGPGGRYAVVA